MYITSFPSFHVPLFQNESSWKTFHIKMTLICVKMNLWGEHIQRNGFVRRLVLAQRIKTIFSMWARLLNANVIFLIISLKSVYAAVQL